MSENVQYTLYTDGACLKNPGGTASFGFVLLGNDTQLEKGFGIIGSGPKMNDVVAEFSGVTQGLLAFRHRWIKPHSILEILCDSQYVVKILNREVSVKSENYLDYRLINLHLAEIKNFNIDVRISWIPRERNKICDDLAKFSRKILT